MWRAVDVLLNIGAASVTSLLHRYTAWHASFNKWANGEKSLLAWQSFQGWVLDKEFAKTLDKGWDLHAVREAAYGALAAVGKQHMHFRPPDEQNDHKVTCGVKTEYADRVGANLLQINSSHSWTLVWFLQVPQACPMIQSVFVSCWGLCGVTDSFGMLQCIRSTWYHKPRGQTSN